MARRLIGAAILLLAPGAALADPPPCPAESLFRAEPGSYWQIADQKLTLAHMLGAAAGGYPSTPWKDSDAGGAKPCQRDQFDAGAYRVTVEQYDGAGGEASVRYRFALSDAKGKAAAYLLLGRAAILTGVARDLRIHPGGVFNLDIVEGGRYASLAMFEGEPDYQVVRAFVEAHVGTMPAR